MELRFLLRSEMPKRNIAAIGSIIAFAVIIVCFTLYRPAKVYQKVPTVDEPKEPSQDWSEGTNKGIPN